MITTKKEWDEFLFNMHDHAAKEFKQTELYYALKEKLDQMESDCKINFCKYDYEYIEAWIETILAISSTECSFIYERGYKDCIELLKQLEVL